MSNIDWLSVVQQTLLITGFVIMMMLLIEFVNVYTKGKFTRSFKNKPVSQILAGVLLGLLPGCMGAFTVVALYTHRVLSFGALVAAMIATSGDEAFFMLILIPDKVLLIFVIMAVTAFLTGLAVDKIFGSYSFVKEKQFSFDVHGENCVNTNTPVFFNISNFRFSVIRISVIAGLVFIILGSGSGLIMHSHGHHLLFKLPEGIENLTEDMEHTLHSCGHISCSGTHDHHHNNNDDCHETDIDWIAISIIFIALICIGIVVFASEHFIKSHIWKHLVLKHLPKILIWTFVIIVGINFVFINTNFGEWVFDNLFLVLIVALLVGIIPESGPHLLFLILFVYGYIPISILIANSLVQDGHGALPLLAESKRSFFVMKLISMVVAFVIGYTGLLLGY